MRTVIVNGMRMTVPDNARVSDLRKDLPNNRRNDKFVHVKGGGVDALVGDDAPVSDGSRFETITEIIKGTLQR